MSNMPNAARIAAVAITSLFALAGPAQAGGSVWLPAPGTGSVTASYVSQSADNLWVGDTGPDPLPFRGLDQTTFLVDVTCGITDAVALDASVGRSEVSPTHGMPIPITSEGTTDLNLGATWRFQDEVLSDGPSMAVRFGLILAGNYEAGGASPVEVMGDASRVGPGPTAIGDGADGFERSGIVGKVFGGRLALLAEVGTRNRTSDVPRETFANLDAHWITGPYVVLSARYHMQSSSGDLDIGPPPGPGAHGSYWYRFPHVAEDVSRVSLGGTLSFDRINVGVHWFRVLDGRNTAEFDAVGGTFTYNFGSLPSRAVSISR